MPDLGGLGVSQQTVEVPDDILAKMDKVSKAAQSLETSDRLRLSGLYFALGNIISDEDEVKTTEQVRQINIQSGTVLIGQGKISSADLRDAMEKVLMDTLGEENKALDKETRETARDLFWAAAKTLRG